MKLIVDMNLSPRWVGVLAGAGIEAAHWSTLGAKNAPDAEIMAYANPAIPAPMTRIAVSPPCADAVSDRDMPTLPPPTTTVHQGPASSPPDHATTYRRAGDSYVPSVAAFFSISLYSSSLIRSMTATTFRGRFLET